MKKGNSMFIGKITAKNIVINGEQIDNKGKPLKNVLILDGDIYIDGKKLENKTEEGK